jgi:hypothetical protein
LRCIVCRSQSPAWRSRENRMQRPLNGSAGM